MKNYPRNKQTFIRWVGIILICCISSLDIKACDICGCGVGSYYLGILPEFQKRFVGIRYQNKMLITHLTPSGSRSYLTTDERYQSVELWGAVNIGKRFRIIGFIPVNHIRKASSEHTDSKTGLGDIALIGYYNLLKSESTTNQFRYLVHTLWVGAGVKAGTGRYNVMDSRENQNLNTFQLGSGSVDFSANAMYDIRLQDAGINTNLSYKMNTQNRYGYQYGNKLTANMLLYYKLRVGAMMSLAPNAGILYESSAKDHSTGNMQVDLSGGYNTLYSFGAELRVKQINIGCNYQRPLAQSLGSGIVQAGNRWMMHLSYGF